MKLLGLLLSLLVLAYWALVPGLDGGFLFDDYVNLPTLGEYGAVDNLHTLALYLTSALGDPIGRPLSMLSFLADANNWPASPLPFLRTNILLHLFNGALLVLVLLYLGRARAMDESWSRRAAVIGAGMWLLHPLFLSTTLYIVQREAMLAATFVLLGLLAWLAGRRRLSSGRRRSGIALLVVGSIVCTGLAILCKANGVLLPLLLLVTETTVLVDGPLDRDFGFVRARRILLGLPIAIAVILMISMLPQFTADAAAHRPWTLTQRLLSEPRVLVDYIKLLVLPRPISSGVFHDNFSASADVMHPLWTLPAILLIAGVVVAACRFRRRWPIAAFALLFFFAGHLLEASIVPLELYFEHRNYLPALPLFWPLAVWLTSTGPLVLLRTGAALLILAGLALDTRAGAQVWGKPKALAIAWATHNPESPRAQAFAAQFEIADGDYAGAQHRLLDSLKLHPHEAQLAFNLADAQCGLDGVQPSTIATMQRAAAASGNSALLDFSWLSAAVTRTPACKGLDLASIESVLRAARSNPRFENAAGRVQDFDHIQGLLSLARAQPEQALIEFDHAIAQWPRPEIALKQAALLASAGRPDLGLRHLDSFAAYPQHSKRFGLSAAQLHVWLLDQSGYWQHELARLRSLLAAESGHPQNASALEGLPLPGSLRDR